MGLCKFFKKCDDWKKINAGNLPDSDSIEHGHDFLCNSGAQYNCDLRDNYIFEYLLNGLPHPVAQA